MAEIESLFATVKRHVMENLDVDNAPLLSAIAKTNHAILGETYDFHSVDDALSLIHTHFSGPEDNHQRGRILETFGARLIVENVEQLTSKYNSVIKDVRVMFPDFNLVQESHSPFYGENTTVPCEFRRCSEDEIVNQMRQHDPYEGQLDEEEIEEEVEMWKEMYETTYTDDPRAKAKNIKDRGVSALPKPVETLLDWGGYTNNHFVNINNFIRCNKGGSVPLTDMVASLITFMPSVVLPFYTSQDFSIYRGDGLSVSSDSLTTQGFYSGSISLDNMRPFVRNGGRLIKINVKAKTPFIPIILNKTDEGEIILLPGTQLTRVSHMPLGDRGHFAEYDVTGHPPKLDNSEEASIFKHAIPLLLEHWADQWTRGGGSRKSMKERKQYIKRLPKEEGGSTAEDRVFFYVNLINRKYGGDW